MSFISSSLRASWLALVGASVLACGDNAAPSDEPDAGVDPPTDGDPDPDPDPAADPLLGDWAPGFSLPGLSGFGARVDDLVRGPDGRIYAGGIFEDAAGVPVHNVAVWDGTTWAPLGEGLNGRVNKLAFAEDGTLWAAVTRDDGLGGALSRWDGAAWVVIGGELDGPVVDLAFVGEDIVIVGEFTDASPTGATSVARWDGEAWHAVGTGKIDGVATAIHAAEGGFCVAGAFASIGGVAAQNVACWARDTWGALGDGLPGGVDVLTRGPDGTWFAGGSLTFVIDPANDVYEAGIAVLRGRSWSSFQGGIRAGAVNRVRDIQFVDDAILIAGNFNVADRLAPVITRGIARWSPTDGWTEVAGGLVNEVGVHGPAETLGYAIEPEPDGGLWIGGLFSRAGGTPAVSVAYAPAVDGTPVALVGDHPVLGIGGFVDALALDGDRVLVGGQFPFTGTESIRNLGALDADGWTSPAFDAPGIVRDIVVRPDATIAVAGDLTVDGRRVAFALWDGGAWTTAGGPVPGDGYDLFVDDDGSLWLAGDLGVEVGQPGKHVRRLDPAGWTSIGDWGGGVTRLIRHDGQLVAGGFFRSVDGAPAAGVAVLDGATWRQHPGGGLDQYGRVGALASSPSLGLIVGGTFTAIGDVEAGSLAHFDGTAWRPLGGGVRGYFGPGFVTALAAHGDGVFVSGGFHYAGDVTAPALAWFDGAAWHDLDGGLQDFAEDLVIVDDRLWIGGVFTVAGGRPSAGLAVWDFAADSAE